jgi:1-acyl-sn-glycerol-3-phosphate acyltransferase
MIFIFPEGTRNGLAKGVRMKKGAAMLALAANAPIIPIGIKGDYKPFSKVRISVGKPISLEKYTTGEDLNPRDVVALTQEMQAEIIKLRDAE